MVPRLCPPSCSLKHGPKCHLVEPHSKRQDARRIVGVRRRISGVCILEPGRLALGRWRAAVVSSLKELTGRTFMAHTFVPLQQAIFVGARGRGSGSIVWSGQWQKSWGEPCSRCHWQPDIAIHIRMRQGVVDENHGPLSDLEPVPASTTMWQPGHAAIFDIGRTTSNTTSYLEQSATHCSIITQHPPTSRRSGKIPRELGE